jgi:uncharacterized membrane protein YdbT with pleckstrin-like domain
MGYVDQNLIEGEHVTYRAPLHWKVMLLPLLLSLLLLTLAIIAFEHALGDDTSRVLLVIGTVLLIASVIPLVKGWVTLASAEFAVTNKRVILKTGFLRKKTAEMFLAKIESVGVDQPVIGRVFGYGSIELRGTGGSLEPFSNITRPLEFRRHIQQQIGETLDRQSSPDRR